MSVNSNGYNCPACGAMIWSGTFHSCNNPLRWANPPTVAPSPLYTLQCCPVCQGRGNIRCTC